MAKRKRTFSLDRLVAELSTLDGRRKTLISQLNAALRSLGRGAGAVAAPFSATARRSRAAGSRSVKRKGRKRTISAAGRKKISDAQKKRWAAQKAGNKK